MDAASIAALLFVPGNRPERFGKALATGAEVVCIDLEDAVPAGDKEAARAAALAAVGGEPRLVVRINGIHTPAGLADLLALADADTLPSLLLVPMVEHPEELRLVRSILGARTPGLVPLIETARGILDAASIASAPGVSTMMFGGGDLSADIGVSLSWEPLLHARRAFILACATAGLPAIDVPFISLDDATGLEQECKAARMLGFAAKAAIHPAQVDIIRQVMRPTPEEIEEARAAEEAFAVAGGAAVRFRGRMLEEPVMRSYRRILAKGNIQHA